MLVPLRWLSDYVDIHLDIEELADRLTMSGTKVETITTVGDRLRHVVAGKSFPSIPIRRLTDSAWSVSIWARIRRLEHW